MSAGANPHRGEAALVLDGIEHVLRPTFGALVAAEEELGPLFALVERASAGHLKLAELAALFWHCLRDRDGADRTAFCEALARAGIAACAPVLRALLVQVLKGKA
ncbi:MULTISPECIES: gene transfer agent family protein [Novosphingobium]|uniref:gene transfer agent family protein n=1 Tax=Novosphingobium TaxID=165696 RepID=UPI001CD67511|nr:gene transfer agent family protein [Novosphingobium percolationis]